MFFGISKPSPHRIKYTETPDPSLYLPAASIKTLQY
jgi:hypothetical protein